MSFYHLRLQDDPILREVSLPVEKFDEGWLDTLIFSMLEIMYDNLGIGISAVQVGHPRQVMICLDSFGSVHVFINPKILVEYGSQVEREGCLSFPGLFRERERPTRLKVAYQDTEGVSKIMSIRDNLLAQCFKHEYDHLQGRLLIDD